MFTVIVPPDPEFREELRKEAVDYRNGDHLLAQAILGQRPHRKPEGGHEGDHDLDAARKIAVAVLVKGRDSFRDLYGRESFRVIARFGFLPPS